jgi:hypothetical protein
MAVQEWIVVSEHELEDERTSGGFIRAACHIHGGDNQRSLSINPQTGFGQCFACGAQVLVREINPDAAAHIQRGKTNIAAGHIRVADPKYIARARQQRAEPPPPAPWQQREIDLLRSLSDSMESRLADDRSGHYLNDRGILLEVASDRGVGYIPEKEYTGKYAPLARWADRIIFPVDSPIDGRHFVGRSLKFWESGMDEETHKAVLEEKGIKRYIKTHRGGWFGFDNLIGTEQGVFVEGGFDALALIGVGIHATAIIGTALTLDWIPLRIQQVILAFDGDESGRKKAEKTAKDVYVHGFQPVICCPPDDERGKDWSARYRVHGYDGLVPLFETV